MTQQSRQLAVIYLGGDGGMFCAQRYWSMGTTVVERASITDAQLEELKASPFFQVQDHDPQAASELSETEKALALKNKELAKQIADLKAAHAAEVAKLNEQLAQKEEQLQKAAGQSQSNKGGEKGTNKG